MGLGYTREDLAAVARGDADRLRWARMRGLAPAPEYEARNRALSGLAERGVGDPPPYYGPSDGKYSGFGTRGEQADYGFGRGIQDWEQAQAFGDATALASDEAYTRIMDTYNRQRREAEATLPTAGSIPELAASIGMSMRGANPDRIEQRLAQPLTKNDSYVREGVPDHWSYEQVPVAPSGADRGLAVALGTPWAQATKPTGQQIQRDGEWVDVMSPAYELRPGFTGGVIGPEDLIPMMRAGGAPDEPATQTLAYGGGRPDLTISPYADVRAANPEVYDAADDRMAQLDKWARESGQDIMAGAAAAADEASVPLYMRAREAGINELGVDPALATAMWGPAEELAYRNAELGLAGVPLKQYQQDQDLSYLEQFGMTKSEYDAMLDDQRQAQDDARQFAEDEFQTNMAYEIADATGLDAKQLADKTDMLPEQILAAIRSEEYKSALDAFATIIASPEGVNSEAVDTVLMNLAQNDPDILRIVLQQFPWLPNVTPSFVGYEPTTGA